MKRTIYTLLVALLGTLAALLLYDRWLVQPRAAALQQAQRSVVTVELDRARAEAKDIARDLDSAAKKGVANTKSTFDAQAKTLTENALAGDAVMQAQPFKVALTEFYQSEMTFPNNNAALGLGRPEAYARNAVRAIAVGAQGVVTILFNDKFEPGATLRLVPTPNPEIGAIAWRCEVAGSSLLARALRDCRDPSAAAK